MAERKHEWARRHGAVHTAGGNVPLPDQIEASCAELAVAQHLNLHWNFAYERNTEVGDVGGYEVRWVRKPGSRLLVRPGDTFARPYVLIEGKAGCYQLVGWLRGTELKPEWLTDFGNGRPAVYAVPRSALRRFM